MPLPVIKPLAKTLRFNAADFFVISRRIIPLNRETEITITPRYRHLSWDFLAGCGKIHFEATRNCGLGLFDGHPFKGDEYDPLEFEIRGKSMVFKFPPVKTEGAICCRLWLEEPDRNRELIFFRFYALDDDLFRLRPYRGDFHAHSSFSFCGKYYEDPEYIAAIARRAGLDFFALTDHNQIDGSFALDDMASRLKTDFRLIHGEECHVLDCGNAEMFRKHGCDPWVHIVNFGGRAGVDHYMNEHFDEFTADVNRRAEEYPADWHPQTRRTAAAADWMIDKIHEYGGIALFCHPYWENHRRFNLPEPVRKAIVAKGKFDVIEVPGLGMPAEYVYDNDLARAMWHEACVAAGRQLPIAGITDSHNAARVIGKNSTLVFASGNTFPELAAAIRKSMTVTISLEHHDREQEHCCGSERLMHFTHFLLREFYPLHDDLCRAEGAMMLAWLRGELELEDINRFGENRINKLLKLFYGE